MRDRILKEAEFWLDSAKQLFDSESVEREKYTVVGAMTIHAIIRANDAMSMKLLGKGASRHDEAIALFKQLIEQNKIPSKFADMRSEILAPAINLKSKVDYKGEELSKAEAEKWIRNAGIFLKCAKESLS